MVGPLCKDFKAFTDEADRYTGTVLYWARRVAWALMLLLLVVGYIGVRLS